jgi:hypothetical protein
MACGAGYQHFRGDSGQNVGQTSGLPVVRASGPESHNTGIRGASGSVNRQDRVSPHAEQLRIFRLSKSAQPPDYLPRHA